MPAGSPSRFDEPSSGTRRTPLPDPDVESAGDQHDSLSAQSTDAASAANEGTYYVQLTLDGQPLCASENSSTWLKAGHRISALSRAVRTANGAQRAQTRIDELDVQLVRMNHRTGSYYLAVFTRAVEGQPKASCRPVRLSEMQQRVATLAAKGETAQQIGIYLGVSSNTVKFHLKRIYELLNVSNRVELSRALDADR